MRGKPADGVLRRSGHSGRRPAWWRSPDLATLTALVIGVAALGYRLYLRVAMDITALYGDDVAFHAMDSISLQNRLFNGPVPPMPHTLLMQRSHALTPLTAMLSQAGVTDLALGAFLVQMAAAAVGLLAIWAATRRLLGPGAAVGAVAILGFAPLPFWLTYWFNPAGMLWPAVAVSLWLLVRAVNTPSLWAAAAVGASVALAFVVKVHGALMMPGVLLALFLAGRLGFEGRRRWIRCLVAAMVFAAVAAAPDLLTRVVTGQKDPQGVASGGRALDETYELIANGRRPSFAVSMVLLFPPGASRGHVGHNFHPQERGDNAGNAWLNPDPSKVDTPLKRWAGLVRLRLTALWTSISYVKTSAFGLLLAAALVGLLIGWRNRGTRLLALLFIVPLPIYLFTWSLHRHLSLLYPFLALLAAAAGVALAAYAARRLPPRLVPGLLLAGVIVVGALQSHEIAYHTSPPSPDKAARLAAAHLTDLDPEMEVVSCQPMVAAYAGRAWRRFSCNWTDLEPFCTSGEGMRGWPAYIFLTSDSRWEPRAMQALAGKCVKQGKVREIASDLNPDHPYYLLGPR